MPKRKSNLSKKSKKARLNNVRISQQISDFRKISQGLLRLERMDILNADVED